MRVRIGLIVVLLLFIRIPAYGNVITEGMWRPLGLITYLEDYAVRLEEVELGQELWWVNSFVDTDLSMGASFKDADMDGTEFGFAAQPKVGGGWRFEFNGPDAGLGMALVVPVADPLVDPPDPPGDPVGVGEGSVVVMLGVGLLGLWLVKRARG